MTDDGLLLENYSHMKQALTKTNIHIKRLNSFMSKLHHLYTEGPSKLQIITDFDHTLSKSHMEDGSKGMSTHALFQSEIPELLDMNKIYFPIEHDNLMSTEEKIPHMKRWWAEAHDLIVAAGYNRKRLEKFVAEECNLQLRDGVIEFFKKVENSGIPVVIFSAGIGDMIEIALEQKLGHVPNNVHIISNRMVYNEQGQVVGFMEPLIHTFNKNSSVIKDAEHAFFRQLHDKTNVLLIGDTIGDLKMDVGVECERTIVKVGFLNHSVDTLLSDYIDGYDVVCVQDQSFNVPLAFINELCDKNVLFC